MVGKFREGEKNTMPNGPASKSTLCRKCNLMITPGQLICWGKGMTARHMSCNPVNPVTPAIDAEVEFIDDSEALTYEVLESESEVIDITPATPKAPAMGGSALAEMLAGEILPFIEGKLSSKADTSEVAAIVNELVDTRLKGLTQTIEVHDNRTDETRAIEGLTHNLFPKLVKMLQIKHVWLYGAAGGGKTTVAMQVAEALGVRFESISIVMQTQPSALLGFIDATGKVVRTPFREVWEFGGVFLMDEICAGTGNFLTIVNGALDNGHCAFPDGNVKRHPDFVCIAADNTPGNGASHLYNGRNKIDAATRERFLFMKWEYDESLERRLALAVNPSAAKWIDFIQAVRKTVDTLGVQVIASPRASILGADMLLDPVFTVDDILNAVLFKGIDESTQAKVLANNPVPTFNREVK